MTAVNVSDMSAKDLRQLKAALGEVLGAEPESGAAQLMPSQLLEFLYAGRASFSVRSKTTGTKKGFEIRLSKKIAGLFNVNSIAPRRNYLGWIKDGKFRNKVKAGDKDGEADAKALVWLLAQLSTPTGHATLQAKAEVWHNGKCGRCGKRLTDPASIAAGLGPTCRKK